MEKFTLHCGIAALLIRNNIDTDSIIPSREMKTVSKVGLSDGLFSGWRYKKESSREPNPDFILNQEAYNNATIILSGTNFGCGSSREHAVWALKEFGFRCIIAESFGSIFLRNCIRNGILPISLDRPAIDRLSKLVESDPRKNTITIDLSAQTLSVDNAEMLSFMVAPSDKEMLLEGLDPIDATEKLLPKIEAFQVRDRLDRSWLY